MQESEKKIIFEKVKHSKHASKAEILITLCSSKTVLDVGCVGQDFDYKNPDWLHNRIKKVCKTIDGVDIDSEGINELNKKGYTVFTPDQLLKGSIKYDIVLLSDVIEHVDNPVDFIKFYSSFLNDQGQMFITTPNAHAIRGFTSILLRNNYSVNSEHTLWLCPKTMTEIIHRADLKFVGFYWLKEYHTFNETKGILNKLIYLFNSVMQKIRSNFYPNFMFILSK